MLPMHNYKPISQMNNVSGSMHIDVM